LIGDQHHVALLRSTTVLSSRKEGHNFLPRPLDQNPGPRVCPYSRGLNPAHRGWDPAYPSSFRRMDWLAAPRLARRAPARQSPRRHSRDALFSSVTSDDDQFPVGPFIGPSTQAISVRCGRDPPTARAKRCASLDAELPDTARSACTERCMVVSSHAACSDASERRLAFSPRRVCELGKGGDPCFSSAF
jgi:hypothetical protein